MYYEGEGVNVDFEEAMRWFKLAAAQGNAEAQQRLGAMYAAGQGVEKDFEQAAHWYELAEKNGYVEAEEATS